MITVPFSNATPNFPGQPLHQTVDPVYKKSENDAKSRNGNPDAEHILRNIPKRHFRSVAASMRKVLYIDCEKCGKK